MSGTIGSISAPTYTLPTLQPQQAATVATPQDLVSLASPAQPQEQSALSRAHSRGLETAADVNDKVGTVLGGTLGLGVLVPAIYAGVIGGVIAGGIAGLGLGPATAVVSGAGGLSFLGTILSTGGAVAKAATVLGTATGAVGGFVVGQSVGRGVAAIPIYAVSYPIGFAKGLVSKDSPYEDPGTQTPPVRPRREKTDGVTKAAQALLGGGGLITGGIGGALLGAGIGSGAALTHGLIVSNLSWSALSAGGVTGAIIGGATLAVVSAAGGYTIASGVSKLIKKATGH